MKRIVFMGTPDFAVPILQQLIEDQYHVVLAVTQPDRPKGRKRTLTPPPVKVEAEKHGIPVFQPEKIKDEYDKVLEYQPDLIVTAAFGQILPKHLLDVPVNGCINVHASLLPELRGGAPIHYAIMQGKEKTGITIMYMVEQLDAGDILTQVTVPIAKDDHVGTLHDKLATAGASLLHETLPALFNNEINSKKQDDSLATYAYNIKREQEKINWEQTNEEIYNHIRGLHPWPVAFTTFQSKNMKIWWGEPINQWNDADPGEIVDVTDEGFVVACGNKKAIKITNVQPAGKKRMTAAEFLRGTGNGISVGEKFGVDHD